MSSYSEIASISATKRVRIEDSNEFDDIKRRCVDGVDRIFATFPDKLVKRLANICEHYLCCAGDYNEPILKSFEFLNSNGADENGGVPFSEAYCSVKRIKGTNQVFGSIFTKGLDILSQYVDKRRMPDSLQERLVLAKLLHYLVDTDLHAPLVNLEQFGETNLSIVLANHLFGQLSASSRHVIDKNSSTLKQKKCPCTPDCDMLSNYGDTSIGNEEIWYGNSDVILNNDVLIKSIVDESSPSILSRNPQIIAQTVVFSFLQRQIHPESTQSLFPCIGVTPTGLMIYFYDSVHDVLLESSRIPLHVKDTPNRKVSLIAILVSWLVVNYTHLCSGLPESLKSTTKAGFFDQVGDKLQIYRSNLRLGNVGGSSHCNQQSDDSDSDVETPDFLTEIRSKFYSVARGADLSEKDSNLCSTVIILQ